MVKYSVITRVHNEGEELWKTVKSVCTQSFGSWELLLIDDGSEEPTKSIVDSCAQLDSRIRVIHQDNQGGLGAFLRGIRESEGEYLGFLDTGDYYDSSYLAEADKILSREEKETDMLLFGFREIFSDYSKVFHLNADERSYTSQELIHIMERTTSFYGLALRVTRRSAFLFTGEETEFYKEIGKSGNFGDDLYLLMPVLRNCQKIYVSHQPLYNYVYHEDSLSHYFPSYTWKDAWNRNRLIGFVYNTVKRCGWLDQEMIYYIRKHALTLLAPCAKWIVRHFVSDRGVQRKFRKDVFFRQIVFRGSIRKEMIEEKKSRFALWALFLRVRFF